jgi:hypothetical protein
MRRSFAILLSALVYGASFGEESPRMQTFSIGKTTLELPAFLETRVENDTLVAYPPGTDFANLRFSVVSITKDGKEVAEAGEKGIRARAAESEAALHDDGDRIWYYVTAPASEGSPGSLVHYWYVGMGGHVLVVSCFVDAAQSSHPLSQRVLASVEPTIRSFKRGPK